PVGAKNDDDITLAKNDGELAPTEMAAAVRLPARGPRAVGRHDGRAARRRGSDVAEGAYHFLDPGGGACPAARVRLPAGRDAGPDDHARVDRGPQGRPAG